MTEEAHGFHIDLSDENGVAASLAKGMVGLATQIAADQRIATCEVMHELVMAAIGSMRQNEHGDCANALLLGLLSKNSSNAAAH